ncbi:MAG: TetR/AcrR family transcriptional regulator [Microthrixaceae bacterium]
MPTSTRVPQEERSRATRLRLLDAAVGCLVEFGYAGTSTTLVSERAGVSRGAQLHHFPSKADLLAAAVEHLATVRGEELIERAARLPAGDRPKVLRALAEHFTSPVFDAALELWVAARTDPELRAAVAPLERRIGRQTHRIALAALAADESVPGTRELVQATLDLIRGLGLADALTDDTRRRARVLDRWAEVLDRELGPAPRSAIAQPTS